MAITRIEQNPNKFLNDVGPSVLGLQCFEVFGGLASGIMPLFVIGTFEFGAGLKVTSPLWRYSMG